MSADFQDALPGNSLPTNDFPTNPLVGYSARKTRRHFLRGILSGAAVTVGTAVAGSVAGFPGNVFASGYTDPSGTSPAQVGGTLPVYRRYSYTVEYDGSTYVNVIGEDGTIIASKSGADKTAAAIQYALDALPTGASGGGRILLKQGLPDTEWNDSITLLDLANVTIENEVDNAFVGATQIENTLAKGPTLHKVYITSDTTYVRRINLIGVHIRLLTITGSNDTSLLGIDQLNFVRCCINQLRIIAPQYPTSNESRVQNIFFDHCRFQVTNPGQIIDGVVYQEGAVGQVFFTSCNFYTNNVAGSNIYDWFYMKPTAWFLFTNCFMFDGRDDGTTSLFHVVGPPVDVATNSIRIQGGIQIENHGAAMTFLTLDAPTTASKYRVIVSWSGELNWTDPIFTLLNNQCSQSEFVSSGGRKSIFHVSLIVHIPSLFSLGKTGFGGNFIGYIDTPGYVPATASITVGASPFTYTNDDGYVEDVAISGDTVSAVSLSRGGVTTPLPASVPLVCLMPQDGVVVTYSSAPTMTKIPRNAEDSDNSLAVIP